MRLGVELVAAAPTRIHLGSFFETWLAVPAGALKRSLGRDEYHLDLTIAANRRLAATGRTFICQLDAEAAELGVNQARAAILVPAEVAEEGRLLLGIRTNVFLELEALMAGARFLLIRHGAAPISFDLEDRRVEPEQVSRGRYLVDLTGLLKTTLSDK